MNQVSSNIVEPEIRFKPWRPWKGRDQPRIEPPQGGVYLFAYCPTESPPDTPDVKNLPACVVYVGDAKDLNKRPLTGTHHRIKRYKALFGRNLKSLFVSFAPLYPTGCESSHNQRAFSFYAEAMLVWEYTKRHGHPPAMHYKDKGIRPDWVREVVFDAAPSDAKKSSCPP